MRHPDGWVRFWAVLSVCCLAVATWSLFWAVHAVWFGLWPQAVAHVAAIVTNVGTSMFASRRRWNREADLRDEILLRRLSFADGSLRGESRVIGQNHGYPDTYEVIVTGEVYVHVGGGLYHLAKNQG